MKNIAWALLSFGLLAAATPAIARQVPIGGVTGTVQEDGLTAGPIEHRAGPRVPAR